MSKKTNKSEPEEVTAPSVTIDPAKLHSLNPSVASEVTQAIAANALVESPKEDAKTTD